MPKPKRYVDIFLRRLRSSSALASAILMTGCATAMAPASWAPDHFVENLPGATTAKHIDAQMAPDLLHLGICTIRVADRRYISTTGVARTDDLQHEARSVDEAVAADGGNAYVIKDFESVQLDGRSRRVVLDFDTLKCLIPKQSTPLRPADIRALPRAADV